MNKITNRAGLMEFIDAATKMVNKYGWEGKITHPYPNVPMKVSEILNQCSDYDSCTSGSKAYLICLADGLRKRMEAWERYELAPKIKVRSKKTGKIALILKEDLDMFEDLVEVI